MWSTDAIHIWAAKVKDRLFLSSVVGVSITVLFSTNSFMLSGFIMNRTAVTVTNTSESFMRTSILVFLFRILQRNFFRLTFLPF